MRVGAGRVRPSRVEKPCVRQVYAAVDPAATIGYFVIILISRYTNEGMNQVYRALADPTRRQILALLREHDMPAGDIASRFDQSWPTISGHLKQLREADLIQADRHGTTLVYHLNVSVLEEAMLALMHAFRIGTEASD